MLNTKLAFATLGAAALLLTSACTKNESSVGPNGVTPPGGKIVPESSASEEGGVNGGGGGTLPAKPVDTYTIFKIVQESKRDLRLYIKYKIYMSDSAATKVDEKAFGGDETLLDVLERTDIEVPLDKPCYDQNGKEVDGSVHASKPNTICISAFRIAPKLIEERARVETEALIVHELSHLMGMTEAEAVDLQQNAAYFLGRTSKKTATDMLGQATHQLTFLMSALGEVEDGINKMSDRQISSQLGQAYTHLVEFSRLAINSPFSVFTRLEDDYFFLQRERLMLANEFVLGQTESESKKEYESIFAGQDSLTYEEFQRRYYGLARTSFGDQVISKLHDYSELKSFVQEFVVYAKELNGYLWNVNENLALPRLHGPWLKSEPNPWEQFVGTYNVVTKNCTLDGMPDIDGKIVRLKVVRDSQEPKGLLLRREWESASAEDALSDSLGGGPAWTVFGGPGVAEVVDELGTSWNELWHKKTYTLSKTPQGFEMHQRYINREWTFAKTSTTTLDCKYELKQVAN